jgi:soluble cytochrome b562
LAAQLKKSTSIVRQSFDGVNSQLEKLQRTLSKDDAKDYAESLEKIATSLEKITELNDSGKLKEIFKAL